MAAVIDFRTASAVPHHAPSGPARPAHPERPRFAVIEGGRSVTGRRQRRTYLRRRLVALAVVVAVLALGAQLVAAASELVVGNGGEVSTAVHRVRPGDSLWAVAASVDPTADPRDVIDRIVELNSTTSPSGSTTAFSADAPLQVGQQLVVPAPRG